MHPSNSKISYGKSLSCQPTLSMSHPSVIMGDQNKQRYAQKNRVFLCPRSKRVVSNPSILKYHMKCLWHVNLPCRCLGGHFWPWGPVSEPQNKQRYAQKNRVFLCSRSNSKSKTQLHCTITGNTSVCLHDYIYLPSRIRKRITDALLRVRDYKKLHSSTLTLSEKKTSLLFCWFLPGHPQFSGPNTEIVGLWPDSRTRGKGLTSRFFRILSNKWRPILTMRCTVNRLNRWIQIQLEYPLLVWSFSWIRTTKRWEIEMSTPTSTVLCFGCSWTIRRRWQIHFPPRIAPASILDEVKRSNQGRISRGVRGVHGRPWCRTVNGVGL